jgi:hypothetical protein
MIKLSITTFVALTVLLSATACDAGNRGPRHHPDRVSTQERAPDMKIITHGSCAPGRVLKVTKQCEETSFGVRCKNECVWANEAD